MAKLSIGPPSAGNFPLASLFLLVIVATSWLELSVLGQLAPYIATLSFAALVLLLIYAFFGASLARLRLWGQLLFIGAGILVVLASDQLMSLLNLRFQMAPLAVTGGVGLTINQIDASWFPWIAFVIALILARHDIARWLHL